MTWTPTRWAAQLSAVAEALLRAIGAQFARPDQARLDAVVDFVRAELGAAEFDAARTAGRTLTVDQGVALGLAG